MISNIKSAWRFFSLMGTKPSFPKKWKKSLDQLKIDGINFISPADKNNSIGNFFQVSSIPRYILIDKSGNVIEDNAKRPNDETLYNDLLKLIDEWVWKK